MLVGPLLANRIERLWQRYNLQFSSVSVSSNPLSDARAVANLLCRQRDWAGGSRFRADAVQALGGQQGV